MIILHKKRESLTRFSDQVGLIGFVSLLGATLSPVLLQRVRQESLFLFNYWSKIKPFLVSTFRNSSAKKAALVDKSGCHHHQLAP